MTAAFDPNTAKPIAAGGFNPATARPVSTGGFDPSSAKPVAASPHAPKPNMLQDVEHNVLGTLQWAAESPVAKGADAVLNATSRLGTGMIAGGASKAGENFMNPGEATDTTHQAERNLHLPVADEHANLAQRIGQLVEDFGVETGADLATYVPGADLFSVGRRVLKYGGRALKEFGPTAKAGEAIAASPLGQAAGGVVDRAKSAVDPFHALTKDLTERGKNVVVGRIAGGKNRLGQQEQQYASKLAEGAPLRDELDTWEKGHAQIAETRRTLYDAIKENPKLSGDLVAKQKQIVDDAYAKSIAAFPQDARQMLLQRAWREGTPDVRAAAEKAGYKPTADEQKMPALNILHRFKDDYEPTQWLADTDTESQKLGEKFREGPVRYQKQGGAAKFDLAKGGGTPETPLADRLLDRLVTGARLENFHNTRNDILQTLGILPHATEESQQQAQSQYIRPGAEMVEHEGEFIDPASARQSAVAQGKPSEDDPRFTRPYTRYQNVNNDTQVFVGPNDKPPDVDKYAGQIRVNNQQVRAAEQARKIGLGAANATQNAATSATGTYVKRIKDAVQAGQMTAEQAAQRLHDLAVRAEQTTASRVARLVPGSPKPESQLVDANGRLVTRNQAAVGRPSTDVANAADAARKVVGKPFERIAAAASKTPSADAIAKPAQIASEKLSGRLGATISRGNAALLREQRARANAEAITAMRAHADDIAKSINVVQMPANLKKYLYDAMPSYNKTLLAQFSDLQRDALFVLPFAHMKNISVLTALGPGGLRTVARGMNYSQMLKTDAGRTALADKIKTLEESGATQRFFNDNEPAYAALGKPGSMLHNLADRGSQALDNYDTGMRLALMDELQTDKRFLKKYPNATDFDRAGEVRDVLGDYVNQSPMVQELRSRLGASFPSWGLGIVPKAMGKAVREQPRAVAAYARGNRLANEDVTEPTIGADLEVGGPLEDYAKMIEQPIKYIASPSRTGAIGDVAGLAAANARGAPGEYIGERAMQAIPGSAVVGNAVGFPYPTNAPAAVSGTAGLAGSYFTPKVPLKQREQQLAALKIKGEERTRILKAEGYLKNNAFAAPTNMFAP